MTPQSQAGESHATFVARRRFNFSRELAQKGWYHSVELPDGSVTDGVIPLWRLRERVSYMPIPEDLRGKRVLDIGAWDGWFSFEMERRGADVVALDCVEVDNFLMAHEARKSKVEYRILDVMEMSPRELGYFDIVLFLGVLYHLKHPLIALEKVCELTRDLAIVESYVIDDPAAVPGYPRMEFYETDQLGEQLDNWFGPSAECLQGLCRTAGFARVELRDSGDERACVACYRKWMPAAQPFTRPAPELVAAMHYRDFGFNFKSNRDDYVSCWFRADGQEFSRDTVFPEVGGYGVKPLQVRRSDDLWVAAFKLPPGLQPGWHEVKLRTEGSPFSNPCRIALDVNAECSGVSIEGLTDSCTWKPGEITTGLMSLWVTGLPETADRGNVRVMIDGRGQAISFVSEPDSHGVRQINAKLKPLVRPGGHECWVEFGDVRSKRVPVDVRPV
jgi:tRNA (mo5U34)-methyltransferase